MKIKTKDYRVSGDHKVDLDKWDTTIPSLYGTENNYREMLAADVDELSALQRILYASATYSVLVIFQAMDAAGKDGAISHVLSGINPEGCEVTNFKAPSPEELGHDFLWRGACRLPSRGKIGIFNRSYYEEVLIVRVHPEILRSQGIPEDLLGNKSLWNGRYRSIVDFENHLFRNGTRVIKIFLHLSKDEQRRRFLERIDEADKNWKFTGADVEERKYWNDYMSAYEECLERSASEHAPWYIVPADDKLNARLIVSRIVIESLKNLSLEYPEISEDRKQELAGIRTTLSRSK